MNKLPKRSTGLEHKNNLGLKKYELTLTTIEFQNRNMEIQARL